MTDFDLVDILLFFRLSRRETYPQAKRLVLRFGSFSGLISAGTDKLIAIGLAPRAIEAVRLIIGATRCLAEAEPTQRVSLGSWAAVVSYIDAPSRVSRPCGFSAILLNNRNQLIKECLLRTGVGIADLADLKAVLLRKALERNATAVIILRHCGETPAAINPIDRAFHDLALNAASALFINVRDVVVVGQGRLDSLRQTRSRRGHANEGGAELERASAPWSMREPITQGFAEVSVRHVEALIELAALADSVRAGTLMPAAKPRLTERSDMNDPDIKLLVQLFDFVLPKTENATAAAAVRHFGSFASVLAAPEAELHRVPGLGTNSVAAIKLVHAAAIRLARGAITEEPVLGDRTRLSAYLAAALARERVEQFRILFLDSDGMLRADEVQATGTVNHTPVYPREVVRRALELGATAIVLVHNHPSGDPTPSEDDIAMTRQIGQAAAALSITLQDHIIVGNGRSLSFREAGLLGLDDDGPRA